MSKAQSPPQSNEGHGKEAQDDEQEENELYDTVGPMSRRDMLKTTGAAAGTVGLASSGVPQGVVDELVDEGTEDAEALLATAAFVGGMALIGGVAVASYYAGRQHTDDTDHTAGSSQQDTLYEFGIDQRKQVVESVNDASQRLETTAAMSRSEAKTKGAQAILDGDTKSQAKSEAIQKIDQYFEGVHQAFYRAQEDTILYLEQVQRTLQNYDSVTFTDVIGSDYMESNGMMIQSVDFWDQDVYFPARDETKTFRQCVLRYGPSSDGTTYDYIDAQYLGYYGEDAPQSESEDPYSDEEPKQYPTEGRYQNKLYATPSYSNDKVQVWDWEPGIGSSNLSIDNEITTQRDNAVSDIQTIMDDLYANYSGEELQEVADNLISATDRLISASTDYLETGNPVYPQFVAYETGNPTTATSYSVTVNYDESVDGGSTDYTTTTDFQSVYDSGASTADTTLTNDEIYIDGDGSGAGRYTSTSDFAATEISFEVTSTTGTVQVTTFDSSGSAGPSATTDTTGTLTVGDGSTEIQSFSLAVGDGSADGTATVTSFTVNQVVDTGVYEEYTTTTDLNPIIDTGLNGNSGDITISDDSVTVSASSDGSMVSAVAGDFPSSSVTGFTPGTTATLDFEALPSSGSVEVEVWDDAGASIETVTVEETGAHEFGDGSSTIWRIDVTVPTSGESVVINSYTLSTVGSNINGTEMNGTLYGWRPAKGQLSKGDVFYVANLDSTPRFMELQDSGTLADRTFDTGGFEIVDITNRSGDSVDSVGVYNPTHTTADTSNLVEQLMNAWEERQDQNEGANSGGGGGGGGGGFTAIAIAIVMAAVAYIFGTQDD